MPSDNTNKWFLQFSSKTCNLIDGAYRLWGDYMAITHREDERLMPSIEESLCIIAQDTGCLRSKSPSSLLED